MKLKKSHLTGQTAIQAANIITREFERVIPGFISNMIGPSITPNECFIRIRADRLLYPVIRTQSDLKYFINKMCHVWSTNWWVSEVTATHKDGKVEGSTLMFNDSVRLDVIAEYRGKPATWKTNTYYVKVTLTILDE